MCVVRKGEVPTVSIFDLVSPLNKDLGLMPLMKDDFLERVQGNSILVAVKYNIKHSVCYVISFMTHAFPKLRI